VNASFGWRLTGSRRHSAGHLVLGGKVPDFSWFKRAPPTFAARRLESTSGGGREAA